MSRPANAILPAVSSCSRTMQRPSVVLPQPDSPTSPSVSPARTSNETLVDRLHLGDRRARTTPPLTGKCFVTPSTSRSMRITRCSGWIVGSRRARRSATRQPAAVVVRRGRRGATQLDRLARRRAKRCGQRGWKAQPGGRSSSDGGRPGIVVSRRGLRPVEPRDRAEQPPGVGMLGVVEDLELRARPRRSGPRTSRARGRRRRRPRPCRG